MGINTATFSGNVTRDPEIKYLDTGLAIASFGIAINGFKSGQKTTFFLDCTAFKKSAETISQYVKKGMPLTISGRLEQEQWNDQQGNAKSKFVLVVNDFQLPLKATTSTEQSVYNEDTVPF